jgi:hypothetical protein
MVASLRALLAGVIDYAGLFPPARLPLDQAVRNYARYRQGPDAWMLGRFVCPAGRLADTPPLLEELLPSGPPVLFAAVGRTAATFSEFAAALRSDLEAVAAFLARQGRGAAVDAFEVALPEEAVRTDPVYHLHPAEVATNAVSQLAEIIDSLKLPALTPFYEFGPRADWRLSIAAVITGVAKDHDPGAQRLHHFCRPGGYKVRCGGTEAAAFPAPEQVAFAITACRDAGVPLKFTAGLHHPVRRLDPALGTHAHGFLNVFAAGALAHARQLGEEQVRGIIADEDAGSFVFTEEGLCWKDYRATTEEIAAARREAVRSFGSCSFDEPSEDLRAMGLLR